jgi:SP family myo-inositol transporter-like MFS transporter 13
MHTLRKVYPTASEDYLGVKLAALEEVVAVSTRSAIAQASTMGQWKIVLTEGRYRRPAITALGIGVFQQLCGFNSLM